jgi:hypothetical protein
MFITELKALKPSALHKCQDALHKALKTRIMADSIEA